MQFMSTSVVRDLPVGSTTHGITRTVRIFFI